MKYRAALLLLLMGASSAACAEGVAVSFAPAGTPATRGAALPVKIPATLSLPKAATQVPAVVLAHASDGLSPYGPESAYVAALNSAGIATLVIDMWTPRGMPSGAAAFGGTGGADQRPRSIRDTLPDVFGALKFLAAQPAIDAKHIGILGFSWGAMLSVLAQIEPAAARALGEAPRFAAHSAHYLVCSNLLPGAPSEPAVAAAWTGAPLQILAGGQDDYDDADGGAACRRFVEALPAPKRSRVELTIYPAATHAWEVNSPYPIVIQDLRSQHGRGGSVRIVSDPEDSAKARAATVAFFKKAFGL